MGFVRCEDPNCGNCKEVAKMLGLIHEDMPIFDPRIKWSSVRR